jgi:IS5 family transposase
MKTKRKSQPGLFDEELRLRKLSLKGDPLERLNKKIQWEEFRPIIEDGLKKEPKAPGGRPPYDALLKFKMLILQRYYNISDEQLEYQVNDRLTFMRFLGLDIASDVPDCNTIWTFREQLKENGIVEKLFEKFLAMLENEGFIANEGSIIDASFVEVPRQRNKKDENDKIKNNEIPDGWEKEENKNKLSHKDMDARWTKKNNENYYGYKDHVKVDKKSKILTKYEVTSANVHDSQKLEDLLDEKDKGKELYGDSAYVGQEETLLKKEVTDCIHEKGYKNRKLTDEQKSNNKVKSKTRVRVEHVFGFIENSMNGSVIKTIGIRRAQVNIGLMNLTYNLFRYMFLSREKCAHFVEMAA